MRVAIAMAALVAVSGCGGGAEDANKAEGKGVQAPAANKARPAAAPAANASSGANTAAPTSNTVIAGGSLPQGFPSNDPNRDGAHCFVYLGMSRSAPDGGGVDNAAMDRAQGRWEANLRSRLEELEVRQLIGSSVNPLLPTPAAQRDAAARWCLDNAPEAGGAD